MIKNSKWIILDGIIRITKLFGSFNQYLLLILFISFLGFSLSAKASEKLRIIVPNDIENEPDDAMSLVRFLTYSNQWDVEGLVATTSVHQRNETAAWRILEILETYELGEYSNMGAVAFDPPAAKYNGNDWVLVLDKSAKKFSCPSSAKIDK